MKSLPAVILSLFAILSLLAFAEETAVVGHAPKLREKAEIQASFKSLAAMIGTLKDESKLTLFEGLPHQVWDRDLLESEKKAKKTVTRYSFPFYQAPNAIAEEDAKRLKALVREPKTFEEFYDFKGCGGFHPDFALIWKDGDTELEIHLCFGCQEFKAYRNEVEVYGEMTDAASAELGKLLSKYQKQRPER